MFSSAARDLRDVVCRSRIRRISELASILAFEAHRASELLSAPLQRSSATLRRSHRSDTRVNAAVRLAESGQ
jgi:hypothetical protein